MIKLKQRVQVYYNLHKSCWSIRDKKTRRVIDHLTALALCNCEFKVSEAGRQRVLRTKRKNVHAWVEGDYLGIDWPASRKTSNVRYNPYQMGTFQASNGESLFESPLVFLNVDRTVEAIL